MANFALWPNRANYHRFREMMQDGEKLPRSFGRWQRIAMEQIAQAQAEGNIVEIVPFNPEKFLAFCREQELSRDGQARGLYATVTGSNRELRATKN
jgi:predicted DNA-binding WGR domain protein